MKRFLSALLFAFSFFAGTAYSSPSPIVPLYSFQPPPSPGTPTAGIIQGIDGFLYGATFCQFGDPNNNSGTIFRLKTDGTDFKIVHSFTGTPNNGCPMTRLFQAKNRLLYGTTYGGGLYGGGVLFRIGLPTTANPNARFTILHHFNPITEGTDYFSGVIQGSDKNLYGTLIGPSNFGGVIYQRKLPTVQDPSMDFKILHRFTGAEGKPNSHLAQGSDGRLYGTTKDGGVFGCGYIYAINPSDSFFNILHFFSCSIAGGSPLEAGVIQGVDGSLYGTDTDWYGNIFKLEKNGLFTSIHSFSVMEEGMGVRDTLVLGTNGNLYGTTTSGGLNNTGSVFVFNPNTKTVSPIAVFPKQSLLGWRANVSEGMDGDLYGTTSSGGKYGFGMVYKVNANIPTQKLMWPLSGRGPGVVNAEGKFGDIWDSGECPIGTDKIHSGTDFKALLGDRVYAAEAGVVVWQTTNDRWGGWVVIEHNQGKPNAFTTLYMHVIPDPLTIGDTSKPNQSVLRNQFIGKIAPLSTGPHLHFGIRLAPFVVLKNYLASAGALPVKTCGKYQAFPENFSDPTLWKYFTNSQPKK